MPRHPVSPQEVSLRLEVRTNHLRSIHTAVLKPKILIFYVGIKMLNLSVKELELKSKVDYKRL